MNAFDILGITPKNGKLSEEQINKVKGYGCLQDKRYEDVFNVRVITGNGKITKANHKKIFFNNIKGKRKYLKGIANQVNNGEKFYKKSRNISGKLANNPIGVIFSPIPTVIGIAGYSICTILSPITAIGTKGENITIPAGSQFEIKLLDNAFIY